jgi:hypothetical protein
MRSIKGLRARARAHTRASSSKITFTQDSIYDLISQLKNEMQLLPKSDTRYNRQTLKIAGELFARCSNFNNVVALREDRLGGKGSRHGARRDLIGRTVLEGEASNSWRALSSPRNIGVPSMPSKY